MKKKILLVGSVDFSKALFDEVAKDNRVSICGLITKKASSVNSDHCDLSPMAMELGIPLFFADERDEDSFIDFVRNLAPDIGYCFGWSHLLRANMLSIPDMGWVGYHPSLLPLNRGRHPIIWALVLGLSHTGSTFFCIDEGADTGQILSQRTVRISEEDDATSLYLKMKIEAIKQVLDINSMVCDGVLRGVPQNCNEGNSWRKRSKKDGHIDFRMPSRGIYNLVRALRPPYPGAYVLYNDKEIIVGRASLIDKIFNGMEYCEPGKIIDVKPDRVYVRSGDGLVSLEGCFPFEILRKGEYFK